MPNFTTTTTITTSRGDTLTASKSGQYEDVFNIRQEVTNTSLILLNAGDKSQGTLEDCRSIIVRNAGDVGGELSINSIEWTNATPDTNGGTGSFQKYLLGAGDYMFLPNFRQLNFQNSGNSGGDAYQLTNYAPVANMYAQVNNPAGSDAQLLAEALDNSETDIDVDDGDFFRVGDLIRIEDEIMEIRGISSDTLTVIRGSHGSSAVVHSDNTALRLAFFNAYADFDKFSVAQTDASGRFKCTNFFGLGRTEGAAAGIVPGSFSMKFYNAGYQELGLNGITQNSDSGLTASTQYFFKISIDGATADEISFTVDTTNVTFGGKNGIVAKMQGAIDALFADKTKNNFEKGATVSITGGDLRITSNQRTSLSAIALTVATSGGAAATRLFSTNTSMGRLAALPKAAVDARLPEENIFDSVTNTSIPNPENLVYDDGLGNLLGAAQGTINYDTGAFEISNAPSNAGFKFIVNHSSAFSGKLNEGTTGRINSVKEILANTFSQKNGSVTVKTF